MNILNSLSFLLFGAIMRFLPVLAPALVAPGAAGVVEAEATTRGMWLVVLGYVFGAVGAWFFMKETTRRVAIGLARAKQRLAVYREAREVARIRQARARAMDTRMVVRVHF